ncbi:Leucine-rich repeat [Arabidopsis suecica]|uniref:Leucine-rich repeat n=1 Tax=Arabidopsis suecica TaxID=45249 RepID=A0A8T2BPE8_ARASU|nr:Leucine-rich repeat [Arabidopsis suecica]KAG7589409.1 Leucine-rich repeat [Arabidopsis suecica]
MELGFSYFLFDKTCNFYNRGGICIEFAMGRKVLLCQNLIWAMIVLGHMHGYKSCVVEERKALLEFRTYMISHSEKFQPDFDKTKFILSSWNNDTKSDCCRWNCVKCNSTSRRVIGLTFMGDMFQPARSLLNLSLLHPFEELHSLDFGPQRFGGFFDNIEGYKSLSRFRNLEILDLSFNEFNHSIFPFLSAATSLTTLFLRGNIMDGPFPVKEFKDLTNLEVLDLSANKFNGSIPVRVLPALRKLKALDISENEFSGPLDLQGICKLENLQELDMSVNKLVGQFPLCITSMSRLRVLDLSSNQLTGEVPSALGSLNSIEYLSLFDNSFKGFFSLSTIANLSELRVFKLSSKSNSLQVVFESYWKPNFQLSVISLRCCNLEKVPHFLLHQNDLRHVDLSDNRISGNIPSWLLANNTKLEALVLRNNSFTSFRLPRSSHSLVYLDVSVNEFSHLVPENIGWILPHLRHMNLANNGFQGNLPSSLGNMKKIEFLDISHNNFNGNLPRSILQGCYSMIVLKLSHNKLSGEVFAESANLTNIDILSMDNNQFTGKIGQGLRNLRYLLLLDISNNNLTGTIPSWIGELPLYALLLSDNSLEGEIPVSLFNTSNLRLLNLSANMLSGGIPPHSKFTFHAGLFLQDNNLSGDIPDTLLADVEILDLRNNRLSGNIPEFINTESISILLLRGNNLTGHIPHQLCSLSNIHLLDLSNNKLNGSIPSCLSNTSFGLGKEDISYYDYGVTSHSRNNYISIFSQDPNFFSTDKVGIYLKSLLILEMFGTDYMASTEAKIQFGTKHQYDAYIGGNLKLLFGIDLSDNELSGEIPVELGGLLELQALNLSHNILSGPIPESFSDIKNMESLDLSFNRLQGQIPPQLTDLSSLVVFNVSYNNLSGVIPQGKQFNTFDTRSYLGNHLLCGQPTNRSCNNNTFQEQDNEVEAHEYSIDLVSFYWSFAAAYVTILLGILVSLSFDFPWSRAWFYIVDAFIHKVRNLLW